MAGDHHEGLETSSGPQPLSSEPGIDSSAIGLSPAPARISPTLTVSTMLALQRTAGNAAVVSALVGPTGALARAPVAPLAAELAAVELFVNDVGQVVAVDVVRAAP